MGSAESSLSALRKSIARLDAQASVVAGAVEVTSGTGLPAAMATADQALARAEGLGPFSVAVERSDRGSHALGEGDWQKSLSEALEEGRITLAGFPVRDAQGRLVHMDCPLRVQLADGGSFESAARWLALAARSRLTHALDLRAVALALKAIEGDGVARCVNLAASSLLATDFVVGVSAQLSATPSAARGLLIDVPESLAASHPVVIQELAGRWRGHGVRIGLEHAGAALSGITRLYELGLDYVRIDGRFVSCISREEGLRRHAEGLVLLLHGIGLAVYAEGVTEAADLQVLWQLGFDAATGPAVAEASA